MARLKFLLAFLAFMICLGGISVAYFYWKKFAEPEWAVSRQMDGRDPRQAKPDLGKRHFDQAIDLLKEGELVAARDRFHYVMTYFPESATVGEARRIVGEINLDLLLSKIPQPGKGEHVVRRGEALVTIARRHETTIDYIMRTNAKTTSVIFPDEVLVVYPLNFRVEIDLKTERLTVFDEESYFKEYRIVDVHLPADLRPPISTTISEKVAWHENRPLNFTDDHYFDCAKWLRSGRMGLFIREDESGRSSGEARSFGVMVSKADMEELFTILRTGAPLALVN